ncbi:DUF503 domain-containing protein [Desulfocurvibacter africanus]|jgi:uncharacterized protein YlxP (DUF503 family)|uniref:DUF503 domain-containing protein n=2 Tax=Desulfocurvibacter africanus TaxID=873 RepID=F3YZZ3_DESAF|nr:DUF503 domain-containing protein [Desulfocurvibacter africanus]EGJ52022.1 protein of unknown function DUF503 [Desulfocurvibacter africanus subsp. africanus str. Walvis Bay]EMG38368.1 hypothetical protein PCS_00871 [Desulfocurvibacter africanus PCS]
MMIGVLRLEFALHDNDSLKGKRSFTNSMKQKLRNKFNVSVSEIESQDSHTRLVLGVVTCGPDTQAVQGRLTKALNMVEAASTEDLVDCSTEYFSD